MKIAVSSRGGDLDAEVDQRFGRAKCFVLYDARSDTVEVLDNAPTLDLPQGAGIQAAQQVIDRKADVVLAGHCGPNAFSTLTAAGLWVVVGASGTVRQAVERFQKGELSPVSQPDVGIGEGGRGCQVETEQDREVRGD